MADLRRATRFSFLPLLVLLAACQAREEEPAALGASDIAGAEKLIGLTFTDSERALMLEELEQHREHYAALREIALANSVRPALVFEPTPERGCSSRERTAVWSEPDRVTRPEDLAALAFYSIGELAHLIETRQVTATELTELFLARLETHDAQLEAVITLTETRAREQAAAADAEIAAGRYRGPLHGIPYGAKDLFAVAGYDTTWGAVPYQHQRLDETATVVERLDEAGAILVAKLSLGALAWGDVWFGGQTRNPWNLEEGASGSSAGSAAAVSAGLVPFASGGGGGGSRVPPAPRVGVTGLRPTFGRVSRHGAMALSWSMDKVGPLCRTVEDCAIVLDAVRGCDGRDPSVVDAPFPYHPQTDLSALRIGFVQADFAADYPGREQDLATLEALGALGVELVPVELPDVPVQALAFILSVEAAAAFDELTRSGRDDLMVRQISQAWPNVFRAARLVPAVEYVQANRVRQQLIEVMHGVFETVDVYLAPSDHGSNLLLTNLTGHPSVVVPNGFADADSPTSITFTGRHFDEAAVLAVAKAYQDATDHHRRHPPGF